ncbi:hypothetical protein ACFLYO_00905 [Chloroflexota bacterium]
MRYLPFGFLLAVDILLTRHIAIQEQRLGRRYTPPALGNCCRLLAFQIIIPHPAIATILGLNGKLGHFLQPVRGYHQQPDQPPEFILNHIYSN